MKDHPDSNQWVRINPGMLSGAPSVRGHRVSVETVVGLAGEGREVLKDGYDLSEAEIDGVMDWWEDHGADWGSGRRFSQRAAHPLPESPQ